MNTQDNSAQNSEQANTFNPRVASTANALTDLFELSKENLSDDRLEWFARLLTPAITEAINVSSNLVNLAMTQGGDHERHDLPSPHELANILFGIADQIDNIKALMCIVEESVYMVSERKAAAQETSGTKKPA